MKNLLKTIRQQMPVGQAGQGVVHGEVLGTFMHERGIANDNMIAPHIDADQQHAGDQQANDSKGARCKKIRPAELALKAESNR